MEIQILKIKLSFKYLKLTITLPISEGSELIGRSKLFSTALSSSSFAEFSC